MIQYRLFLVIAMYYSVRLKFGFGTETKVQFRYGAVHKLCRFGREGRGSAQKTMLDDGERGGV